MSENKVTAVKGLVFFSTPPALTEEAAVLRECREWVRKEVQGPPRKQTKSCISDVGPECVCDVWCLCMSQAGGEGITHKISCCPIPVAAPVSLGCADSLLVKAECANTVAVQ